MLWCRQYLEQRKQMSLTEKVVYDKLIKTLIYGG